MISPRLRHFRIPRFLPVPLALAAALCAVYPATSATELRFLLPGDVSQAQGITQTVQLPEKGLLLAPKDPARQSLWYMPVAALPSKGGTRIWFQRVDKQEREYSDQRTLCVGDLTDAGWSPLALSSDSLPWGGPNNVCMRRSPHKPTWGGFNVFQILPVGQVFEMLYWDQPDAAGKAGAMRASSPDGLSWQKQSGAVFTETNDAFTLMRAENGFLLYQTKLEEWPDKPYEDNIPKQKRVIALRESPDLQSWSPQKILLRPDSQDAPECEFYLMKAFRYRDALAGLVMKYYADPKLPGKHSAILKYELIVSKDGVDWLRPYRDTDIGFWSYADPFLHQGRLHFAIWKDAGMETVSYMPGRLVGVTALSDGSFVTTPVSGLGQSLFLDIDARNGWVELECLKPDTPAPVPVGRLESVDGEHVPLRVPDSIQGSVSARLLVRLHQATLFGIQFE